MRRPTIPEIVMAVLLVAAIAVIWKEWHREAGKPASPAPTFQPAPVESPVKKIAKAPIQKAAPPLAYDKTAIADKLDLPAEILADETKQVITNGEVPATEAGASVVTVFDNKTGDSTTLFKAKELPLFEFENHGQVGGFYGYNEHLQGVTQGSLQWQFLRIKQAHVAVKVQGDNDHFFGGAGVLYEW